MGVCFILGIISLDQLLSLSSIAHDMLLEDKVEEGKTVPYSSQNDRIKT